MSPAPASRARIPLVALALLTTATLLVPSPACSSDDPQATPGPSDAGGEGTDASDTGDDGPASDLCLAANDLAIFTGQAGVDLELETRTCVKALVTGGKGPSSPDFADLVAACLVKSVALSEPCALCQARFADCSADQCLNQCIVDPESKQCVDCRCGVSAALDCIGALEHCSGVPSNTCD